MRIDIITIFPKMFAPVLNESIMKRAQQNKRVKIFIHDLRGYTTNKHRKVDDRPFGGGSGMVMCAQPIFAAVETIKKKAGRACKPFVVLLTPAGESFSQETAFKLSRRKHIILICGRYEGIDQRVADALADMEVSIGDYVLTGGEVPAMVVADALVRLLPGVLGDKNSLNFETFKGNLLEYPHYTRPAIYRGMKVPQVLLCGDHKKIEQWRKQQSVKRTKEKRPDLLKKGRRR